MENDFTEFYFIRHGESMANVNNLLQGWGNSPLSENGRAQAQCAAKALTDVKFDIAYSSSLDRASETARIILAGHPGVQLRLEDDLREWWVGDLESREQNEVLRENPVLMDRLLHECGEIIIPGGETKSQFQTRISNVLDRIARNHAGERVLLTSHGWAAHRVFAHVYGSPAPGRRYSVPNNASISIFRYFPAEDTWLLVAWNRTEHLAGLAVRQNPFG